MLINKVSDEARGEEGRAAAVCLDSNPEYQTASELFELMTKDAHFDANDDDSLTTQDLVLLYKNIDIGTKLMNEATVVKLKQPNQYVESIVYNDEPESGSETSEIYGAEDLQSVFLANQERLDFLNDKSLENLLCHKLGGLEIKTSEISMDYGRNFLFKDPSVTRQLKNLNVMTSASECDTLLSTSLLDYICCKRLEDNYNFYMDNIIKYVQHTIEQLKRISNGDYLTERAKEKWSEVNSNQQQNNTKVLATSTSIPLHVECKGTGNATWDDIVHSEVDVRSLSKILEKKIVVEIPKLICGSYRLYSKRCADNLIISCQREMEDPKQKDESRVDVVLQLQRSQTGQVMSKISSIMILRTSPSIADMRAKEILPEPYKEAIDLGSLTNNENFDEPTGTVIELNKETDINTNVVVTELELENQYVVETVEQQIEEYQESQNESSIVTADYSFSDQNASCDNTSKPYSSETCLFVKDVSEKPMFSVSNNEAYYNRIPADELRKTMQRLNMETTVLDEAVEDVTSQVISKKRSPVRIRIKSPYENKSFLLEEKKRKRLLEIRDRREKKKMALNENCKITKHKYGKGAIMPQASSSVTKLSISNKSFYNSIYGQSFNVDKPPKARKVHKNNISVLDESCTEQLQMGEYFESPMLTPEKNSKKYINRSYYLDDAETEMMHMQMKLNKNMNVQNPCSASNSVVSNEFTDNLNLLQQLIGPPEVTFNVEQTYVADEKPLNLVRGSCDGEEPLFTRPVVDTVVQNLVPTNSADDTQMAPKKVSSSDECRKSIDKLYELINKFGKPNVFADLKTTKSKARTNVEASDGIGGQSTVQGSDSGTSVKHHVTSSSLHSSFCSERNNIEIMSKSSKNQSSVVPKVIISSKLQPPKIETDKMKKDRRKAIFGTTSKAAPDNPLKAISQLLHEFDNVQKTRQKPTLETRPLKKMEVAPNDVKNSSRQGFYGTRRSRLEQHLKDNDHEKKLVPTYYHHTTKDKRARPVPTEITRNIHQQNPVEDKNFDKIAKKKIADIIDEAKEARGEAVRGPSKFYSRLNSLAQPKKSYVQAHHEEYSTRYGRNMLAERLQKLASAVAAPTTERNVVSPTLKSRCNRMTAASVKQPASSVPHLDKGAKFTRLHHSASSSSSSDRPVPVTYKHSLPDAPEAIRKMAAVETYVKSHYGPCSEVLLAGHKSRVPHVPQDLELASISSSPTVQKSFELGNKLHHMIDCMLTNESPLTALTECPESISKPSNSDLSEKIFSGEARTDSDFCLNILEDNLETAVETIDLKKDNNLCTRSSKYDLQPLNSTTELEKLETALYNQISGSFQKRLRIKNLTLTPKCSMQQVFFVQSGDAGPLHVKSTVSNLKINRCSAESLHDLKVMSVLSSSHLDWNFTQIPMQIATVGYAFPEYQASRNALNSTVKLLEVPSVENSEIEVQKNSQSHKISQCFKEIFQKPMIDSSEQVDIRQEIVAVSVGSLTSHATNSQMLVEIEKIEIAKNLLPPNNLAIVTELEYTCDSNKAVKNNDYAIKEIQEERIKETGENSNPMSISDAIDNTTSLDMLVGLLNEIQKITGQNQMAAACNNQNCAGLEKILYDAAALENVTFSTSRNVISMSSLDNLRQLESETSVYSFYISNDDESENNVEPIVEDKVTQFTEICDDITDAQLFNNDNVNKELSNRNMATEVSKPAGIDKEVSANILESNVDTFTEVPSLMPITVNHGTNVTNSAVGVISEPSTQSILSFTDYQTLYSNTLFRNHPSIKKLLELPHIEVNEQRELISRDKADLNEKFLKTNFTSIHNFEEIKNDRSLIARSELSKYCVKNIDLDPMFKIKRDMLVTMYSILVLTVFAALSFPELIMFQYY